MWTSITDRTSTDWGFESKISKTLCRYVVQSRCCWSVEGTFGMFLTLTLFFESISHHHSTHQRTIQFIRNYLDTRDFIEVETPILSSSSGGANATPFETHSFGLNTNLKLRISPELYLKQLLVGGLDRVYEIGKVFRNEGISPVRSVRVFHPIH